MKIYIKTYIKVFELAIGIYIILVLSNILLFTYSVELTILLNNSKSDGRDVISFDAHSNLLSPDRKKLYEALYLHIKGFK